MAPNFEPNEYVTFVKSKKVGAHENKGIHSIWNSEFDQS